MKLNESELKDRIFQIYKEEQYKILEKKWNKLSKEDKIFVFEFAKKIYPEQTKLIKESKWYNTLGDIVGIFDPTGIVDIVNGISYWRQGDKLYAILSFVSAIPILGDLIAKPVIGVMKLGGGAAKAFKAATLTGDAVKMASTSKRAGGPIAKMVETAPTWGEKLVTALKGSIGRVPLLGSGLVKSADRLFAVPDNFDFEAKFTITKFNMIVVKPRADAIVRQGTSNVLSSQMLQDLKGITPGSRLIFDNIIAVGPDGSQRSLTPIVINVN